MDKQLLKQSICLLQAVFVQKKKDDRASFTQGLLIYRVMFWNLKMQYYL